MPQSSPRCVSDALLQDQVHDFNNTHQDLRNEHIDDQLRSALLNVLTLLVADNGDLHVHVDTISISLIDHRRHHSLMAAVNISVSTTIAVGIVNSIGSIGDIDFIGKTARSRARRRPASFRIQVNTKKLRDLRLSKLRAAAILSTIATHLFSKQLLGTCEDFHSTC